MLISVGKNYPDASKSIENVEVMIIFLDTF